MAATSHDFWLHNLTAPVWKALHMSVYVAYALHRAARVVRRRSGRDASRGSWLLLAAGALLVFGLHVSPAARERVRAIDAARATAPDSERLRGRVRMSTTSPSAARSSPASPASASPSFATTARLSALSNVCQHQNGPLGEGRIVNDCVVCPWHGYEYLPERARRRRRSPRGADVQRPPGRRPRARRSPAESAGHARRAGAHSDCTPHDSSSDDRDEFYIGYEPPLPRRARDDSSRVVMDAARVAWPRP